MAASSKSDKKAILRAWREGQRMDARSKFPLPDETLSRFFSKLETRCEAAGCAHDYCNSKAVALELGLTDSESNDLFAWCRENGGYCDCEITANTFEAWEEARARS